jgi:hypothetical protein
MTRTRPVLNQHIPHSKRPIENNPAFAVDESSKIVHYSKLHFATAV